MATHVVLLRGVNVGGRNRVAMAALRQALAGDGLDDVRTYLQSGNVVLESGAAADEVAAECGRRLAARLGLDVPVVVRTRDELAEVVARDPLREEATDPRRYQVSFLAADPGEGLLPRLQAVAAPSERVVLLGREVYAWHPAGVARSKLWALLAGRGLGVPATARNWTTVTSLLALAGA